MKQFILGTMRLDMNDEQSAVELLTTAKNKGIDYLDTADIYGDYQMNEFLGRVLKQNPELQNHFKIIGKTGIRSPKQAGTDYKHYDYTPEYIRGAVEKMCREFGRDHLDYLLLHRPSPLMNFSEIGKVLLDLQHKGIVQKLGVSNFNVEEMKALNQYVEIATNQIEFSPLSYENYENNVFTYLQARRMNAQIWSPLAGGKVFEPSPLFDALTKHANVHNVSVEAIIYAFIAKLPFTNSIILGTTKKERLNVLDEMATFELPLEAWFEIAAASQNYVVK